MRQTNYIQFDDPNDDRQIALVSYPEILVFADSARCPVDVRMADEDNVPNYNADVILSVKEYGSPHDGFTEMRSTDRQGMAYFDIARYVQLILGDTDADGVFDYSQDSALVTQKHIEVTLTAFGTTFYTFTFDAVHGNNRVTDRWWSMQRKMRWWPAYPFAFDFPNVAEAKKTIGDAIATVTFPQVQTSLSNARARVKASYFSNGTFKLESVSMDGKQTGMSFGIAQSTDTGHIAGTKLFVRSTNSVMLIADGCQADINAAYLRWLDGHCELRHWLFMRHSESDTVKTAIDRRAGYDHDRITDGVLRDGRMTDGTLSREITVNTGMLQEWEHEIASSIVNAPFVDMLDMDEYINHGNTVWHRLIVKGGSYSRQLRNRHASDQDQTVVVTLQYDEERSIGV